MRNLSAELGTFKPIEGGVLSVAQLALLTVNETQGSLRGAVFRKVWTGTIPAKRGRAFTVLRNVTEFRAIVALYNGNMIGATVKNPHFKNVIKNVILLLDLNDT